MIQALNMKFKSNFTHKNSPKCSLIKQTQELQIRAIIKHTIPGNTGNAAQLMRLCSEWMNKLLIGTYKQDMKHRWWKWGRENQSVIKQTHTVFYRTLTPDTRKLFTTFSSLLSPPPPPPSSSLTADDFVSYLIRWHPSATSSLQPTSTHTFPLFFLTPHREQGLQSVLCRSLPTY